MPSSEHDFNVSRSDGAFQAVIAPPRRLKGVRDGKELSCIKGALRCSKLF
jgi:hypothetical protein